MKYLKGVILVVFFASLATAASFSTFKWRIFESLNRVCDSIEVYLQMGSYRTARELAAAALQSSYPNVDAQFSFDNLKEPSPRDPKKSLLKSSCSVAGRDHTPFDIYIFPNSGLMRWLAEIFVEWIFIFAGILLVFGVALRTASHVILNQVNSALAARLGFRAAKTDRPGWLVSWLNSAPVLAEATTRTHTLIERLDQEIARTSDLERAVERRRIFSKYLHDIRSPIGTLKILFAKKGAVFSPDEADIIEQVISRLEEIPSTVLEREKEANDPIKSHLRTHDVRIVMEHVNRRLAIRMTGGCELIFENAIPEEEKINKISISAVDLDRLITNLVENAKQAGATKISVQALASPNQIVFEIADNGPGGLGPNLSPSPKKVSGYGLGLEIVREITARGQAQVEVSSPPGSGTKIRIAFPTKS